MLAGLTELGHPPPARRGRQRLAHATTLVANAVIESKGAKTALLSTAGFRDVIELRRYVRVTTYEMFADPPRRWCRAIYDCRSTSAHARTASMLRPVDPAKIEHDCSAAEAEDVERSPSASCTPSTNPANERAAGELLTGCYQVSRSRSHPPCFPRSRSTNAARQRSSTPM